ncbi:glycoside hydrolase family 32 protein [Aureitalea marina]|uniref:Glycosyl hydrolase family 32 n=1 Tax=Aureitalea marina TaxID=930804 RepID=A0A2S7KRJ3_9FLAO|nr:glycoside hydrolase family 32 protein [Aureitalea marina]PQB05236.1 glycosyl hydrolase family 32 [Aureitalea marina]
MRYICLLLILVGISCKNNIQPEIEETVTGMEDYRPLYHFTPQEKWMNDPNGMVYYKGEYHLFYQYYPDDIVWGPMHWGHAVSSDMVNWEHLPIALYPDSLGYIFSGSAVVDWKNTSGLGSEENPALIAIFTYHEPEAAETDALDFQYQGIAYSLDGGREWIKYEGNPVLPNPGIRDFRDPKVRWHEPSQRWIMTLAVADHISFYSSENLLDWNKESDFGLEWGSHGGVWECPDLIPMQVEGSDEQRWVLLVSINPGGPQGGSATQYFIGEFNGNAFTLDTAFEQNLLPRPAQEGELEKAVWLDHGADNYAGVTWSDNPDDRILFIGWMSNWQYAQLVPTASWRSAMTLPRSLSLHREGDSFRVHSTVVQEAEQLLGAEIAKEELGPASYVDFQVNGDCLFTLSNDSNEKIQIQLTDGQLLFDRTKAGISDFEEGFAAIHKLDLDELQVERIELYLDASSVELFVNQGQRVMTELVFPTTPYTKLEVEGQARIKGLRRIKPMELTVANQ